MEFLPSPLVLLKPQSKIIHTWIKTRTEKLIKLNFENAPPQPPAPKKASAEGEVRSSDKSDAAPAPGNKLLQAQLHLTQ